MTCPICRQGALKSGVADEVLLHQGTTLVVKGVPAEICDTRGESYLDEAITQQLLDFAREASEAGVVVDVRQFKAA